MKIKLSCVLLINILIVIKADRIDTKNVGDLNMTNNVVQDKYYDMLIESLAQEEWPPKEKPCFNAMRTVYESAKNATLYGAWMMDSTQLPVGQLFSARYHLGNYDNCVKSQKVFTINDPDLLTHYCLVNIHFSGRLQKRTSIFSQNTSLDTFVNTFTKHKFNSSYMYCGVCAPRACKQESIPKIYRARLRYSHLSSLADKAKISTLYCITDKTPQENNIGLYILMSILAGIVVTTIFCTYLLKKYVYSSKSFAIELASCFCINRNFDSLTKLRDDEITSMNFLRLCSSFIIIYAHYFISEYIPMAVNKLDIELMTDNYFIKAELAVDTFFTLSGLLYVRGFLNNIKQNEFKYLWKRYVRLIVSYLAVMLFHIYALKNFGDGPIWPRFSGFMSYPCKEYPWINIFMLSNFSVFKMCAPVSWYVACDFQLCIMATFILFIYKRHQTVGKLIFFTLLIFLTALPGVVIYMNNYPIQLFHGFDYLFGLFTDAYYMNIYVLSYHRAAPFMIGMAVGYFVCHFNPANYRKVISKKWSFIGIVFSAFLILFDLSGYFTLRYSSDFDLLEGSIYSSLHKVSWSTAIVILICVSEYGDLPVLNDFFLWYPLSVLSRLTYGVYLTHLTILQIGVLSLRSPVTFTQFQMILKALGLMVISMFISFFIWMILEAPVINLNNLLMSKLQVFISWISRGNSTDSDNSHLESNPDRLQEEKK